ncbi:MAG: hypothetical protein WBO09_16120 [Methylocystis silviterrae]|uniref:hypothetical protein n=1 Tax=Methylocystis silviterrae TaxID=2743612 RepID=UPI003C750F0E
MELSTILTLSFSTGFMTAVFTQAIGWVREARHEKLAAGRDARYLAIRLAVILERFAINCAENIVAQDMYRESGGHAGIRHSTLPDLPPYPDEADWKALEPDFLARALTFRNELPLADKAIAFWEEIERDCIPQECDQQCGKCGYIAWVLAGDMRRHYNLGAFDPKQASWDIVNTLKPLHDEALERASERAA